MRFTTNVFSAWPSSKSIFFSYGAKPFFSATMLYGLLASRSTASALSLKRSEGMGRRSSPLTSVTAEEEAEGAKTDYLYEPSPERILDVLLVQLVQAQVLRALVESNAAFFAAQMTAMDAATRNSSEMIEGLTLYMNKLRQAAITREIIEVVSGSQR